MSTQPSRIPQATAPAPALMPNQGRSWWGRNWKKLLAAMFLCGAVFVVGIFALIMGAMRSSDVAKEAIARAQASQLLSQRLGAPISEGWLVSGSINVSPAPVTPTFPCPSPVLRVRAPFMSGLRKLPGHGHTS